MFKLPGKSTTYCLERDMPWTIPNLLLHDKPLPQSDQRASGYAHVFAYCLYPGCHHNAVLDVSHLSDETTYNDLQRRIGLQSLRPPGAQMFRVGEF